MARMIRVFGSIDELPLGPGGAAPNGYEFFFPKDSDQMYLKPTKLDYPYLGSSTGRFSSKENFPFHAVDFAHLEERVMNSFTPAKRYGQEFVDNLPKQMNRVDVIQLLREAILLSRRFSVKTGMSAEAIVDSIRDTNTRRLNGSQAAYETQLKLVADKMYPNPTKKLKAQMFNPTQVWYRFDPAKNIFEFAMNERPNYWRPCGMSELNADLIMFLAGVRSEPYNME